METSHRTMTFPVIPIDPWNWQWYAYVPETLNVIVLLAPPAIDPVSQAELSLVAVCGE
jgi:hypothetical protein